MLEYAIIGDRFQNARQIVVIPRIGIDKLRKLESRYTTLSPYIYIGDNIWRVFEYKTFVNQAQAEGYVIKEYGKYCWSCYKKNCDCGATE